MILGETYTESFAARLEKIKASYRGGKFPIFMVNDAKEYDIIDNIRRQEDFLIDIPTDMMMKSSNEYSYPLIIATHIRGNEDEYEDTDELVDDNYSILNTPKTFTVYTLNEFKNSKFAIYTYITSNIYDILIENKELLNYMNNIVEYGDFGDFGLPF